MQYPVALEAPADVELDGTHRAQRLLTAAEQVGASLGRRVGPLQAVEARHSDSSNIRHHRQSSVAPHTS
jgi:hypothetical protein